MSEYSARPGRAAPEESSLPRIVERPTQPYAAIRGEVSMQTIAAIADRIPELIGLLAQRGVAPAGAPFLKYEVIGPGDELVVLAGIPVDDTGPDDDPVEYGVLPGGRYGLLTHYGHFEGLMESTRALLEYGDDEGLTWDMRYGEDSERWAARLEVYLTDPREEPDPDNWQTDLMIRLAD